MGDIADMMLDGTLCEGCGESLFDDELGQNTHSEGTPDYCSPECAEDRGAEWWLLQHGYKKYNGRWKKQ